MYRLIRTARVKAGHPEAWTWNKAGPPLINKKYPGHSFETYVEQFGTLGTYYWTATFKDLQDLETFFQKLEADPEYLAWAQKGLDYFVEGTFHDTLMGND